MQVRLDVSQDNSNIKKVVLKKDALIGRSTNCNLRIASSGISREHCKLLISDEGVFIRDLGSSNGTYVNGEQIAPKEEIQLTPGSKLSVGSVNFVVRFKAPKSQEPEPGSTVDLPPKEGDTSAVAAEEPTKVEGQEDAENDEKITTEDTVVSEAEMAEESAAEISDTAELEEGVLEEVNEDESATNDSQASDLIEIEDEPEKDLIEIDDEPEDNLIEIDDDDSVEDLEFDELLGDSADEDPADEDEETVMFDASAMAAAEVAHNEFSIDTEDESTAVADDESQQEFAEVEDVETDEDEVEVEEEKPGKLKSLFGLLGRKSKSQKAEAATETDDGQEQTSEEETIVSEAEETIQESSEEAPTIQADASEVEASDDEQEPDDEDYQYEEVDDFSNFSIDTDEDNDVSGSDDMTDFLSQFDQK